MKLLLLLFLSLYKADDCWQCITTEDGKETGKNCQDFFSEEDSQLMINGTMTKSKMVKCEKSDCMC